MKQLETQQTNFLSLSDFVIEDILSFIPNLSKGIFLVNRRLNEITSNSKKLMKNFTLNIDASKKYYKKPNFFDKLTRKYTAIKIQNNLQDDSKVLQILSSGGFFEIHFKNSKFSYDVFGEILLMNCSTLSTLNLIKCDFEGDLKIPTNLKFVKPLHVTSKHSSTQMILQYLENANVTSFKCEENPSSGNPEAIKTFLMNQKNIKTLAISNIGSVIFLNIKSIEKFEFPLEHFEITNKRSQDSAMLWPEICKENLEIFLQKKVSTLKSVTLDDIFIFLVLLFATLRCPALLNVQIKFSKEETKVRHGRCSWIFKYLGQGWRWIKNLQ